jgi:DNA-3-methyladenine glycosylase II
VKTALAHLRKSDPLLAAVIERVGPYAIRYHQPVFETLVRSIVFQQLNGKAAATIYGRLEQACGAAGVTPERILRIRPDKLRAIGLSQQKSSYIRDLAMRTRQREIDFASLDGLPDHEVISALTVVKGVGVWTAQMFLMFALKRPDVLPTADYGIRAAMQKLYNLPALPKPAEMERIAQPWSPWTSVACWYLWRSMDGQVEL